MSEFGIVKIETPYNFVSVCDLIKLESLLDSIPSDLYAKIFFHFFDPCFTGDTIGQDLNAEIHGDSIHVTAAEVILELAFDPVKKDLVVASSETITNMPSNDTNDMVPIT